MRENQVRSLGWEDPLEKEMATHSSTLAGRIPWREEPPGRLQSMGSQRVGHYWATSHSLTQKYHKQVKREGHSKRTFIKWDEHFEPSESESRWVVSDYWWPHGLYSPWNSPGQNAGVGSLSFPQGIFPTQELNPGILHCRQMPYRLNYMRIWTQLKNSEALPALNFKLGANFSLAFLLLLLLLSRFSRVRLCATP